jgi:hypothetical protein
MRTGRPKKSARESHRWFARLVAEVLREAIRRTREFDPTCEDGAEFQARGLRAKNAWDYLSVLLCNYCDADAPSKLLRQVADELDGELMHSEADERIFRAYLRAILKAKGGPITFKKMTKELGGNPLSSDYALRRTIKRLGLTLEKKTKSI